MSDAADHDRDHDRAILATIIDAIELAFIWQGILYATVQFLGGKPTIHLLTDLRGLNAVLTIARPIAVVDIVGDLIDAL